MREKITQLVLVVTSASPLTYSSVGVGIFVAALYFKIVFGSFQGFCESLDGSAGWLSGPKHGAVMSITVDELQRLTAFFSRSEN
jgi:hypothetical protein